MTGAMSGAMSGWGMALRIAWRDAVRHRGRSALVLTLIALPVLLVSAGAIVGFTGDVRGAERIERELGAAEALVWSDGSEVVNQRPDPFEGISYEGNTESVAGPEQIAAVLGADVELQPVLRGETDVLTADGDAVVVSVREADFAEPLLEGLVTLLDGRLPEDAGEVVVTEDLRREGFEIGAQFPVRDVEPAPVVVGVVEDVAQVRGELAYGPAGSLLGPDAPVRDEPWSTQWLVGGDPVTWDEVRALNAIGVVAVSREVLTNPPPESQVAFEDWVSGSEQAEMVAVAALIVAMVLIEVVLLAGPAFAVTARNHTRTLALVAASGGTPRQARRVILAGGLVLGLAATVAGLVLSVPLAAAVLPGAQRLSDQRFGPFDVPWGWLAAVAAFGLASALLAAVVPAWLTSRQDVVAALAGRRSDRAPDLRMPLLGVGVLGLGVAGASYGALNHQHLGPVLMSASAVVTVLGMILVVPAVVAGVARLAGRLPLPMRYAARDAARHRTRTVPAVAAVAATVAGVVALGIANASDALESRETYVPMAAHGTGQVTYDSEYGGGDAVPWAELEAAVLSGAPDAEVTPVQGLPDRWGEQYSSHWRLSVPGRRHLSFLDGWGSPFSASILVGGEEHLGLLSEAERAQALEVVESGRVVVFASRDVEVDEVTIAQRGRDDDGARVRGPRVTLPAQVVRIEGSYARGEAVVPASLADRFGDGVETVGLQVAAADGALDEDTEEAVRGALRDADRNAHLYVERGYQRDVYTLVILWVLGVVGGLLMLAGTLTATFLSLSDARPDLATVSAVGGAPRTRRQVAAAYALIIATLGAVLGALVGFVPGVAVSRPLTSGYDGAGPFLEIPWLLIGAVVVLLPLVAAAVVWLSARSRLPMVARID